MDIIGDFTTAGASSSKGVDGDKMGGDPLDHSPAQVTIPEQEGVATMPLEADEPYEGQLFDSEEAAHAFYNGYASRAGFSIRKTCLRRSRTDNSPIGQSFVCSKEGFKTIRCKKIIRKRVETRVGCKAKIKLRKDANSSKWKITKFVKEHNHPLTPGKGRKDGLYDKFPSEHDISRELIKQLEEEKKKSAKYKRKAELLIEACEDCLEQISKKMQKVIANIKEIEEEDEEEEEEEEEDDDDDDDDDDEKKKEEEEQQQLQQMSNKRYRKRKQENPWEKMPNVVENDWMWWEDEFW